MSRTLALPLAERRCTTCGRGVGDGATFYHRPGGGPHSYRPVCADCDQGRVRAARREHGWDYGMRGPKPVSSPSGLTRRQRDVLRLLARGLGDCQIARALGIADSTARHIAAAIYARMPPGEGNNYRVRAALWWFTWEERHDDQPS